MINKQLIAMMLGSFAGITLVAYASSTACNKTVEVDCVDMERIDVFSPNCGTEDRYPADVVDHGSVLALTAATAAGTGYTEWNQSSQKCAFVCQIIADCKGLSPQVVRHGSIGNYVRASGAEPCP